jgi:hypothetical protein
MNDEIEAGNGGAFRIVSKMTQEISKMSPELSAEGT